MADAQFTQLTDELARRCRCALSPALDSDHAVARIDARGNGVAEPCDRRTHEIGVGRELGAEHHPRHSRVRESLHRIQRSDAPAGLDRDADLSHDSLHHVDVARNAIAGPIEIHHVNPLGPLLGEAGRLRHRVIVVDGDPVVVPLSEPHGTTAQNVYRRKHDHARAPSTMAPKFPSSFSPALELFSG